MEKQSQELTPIDIKNYQKTKGEVPVTAETIGEYKIEVEHLESVNVLGSDIHKGQVIETAPQYSVDDFEKMGDVTHMILVNTKTNDRIRIPIEKLGDIKNIDDIGLFAIQGHSREAKEQIDRGLKAKRTEVIKQGVKKLEQNVVDLQNIVAKDPQNSEIKKYITITKEAALLANDVKELQRMVEDPRVRKSDLSADDAKKRLETAQSLLNTKLEEMKGLTTIQTPETIKTPTTETIDEYKKFVDTGEVSEKTLEDIAQKIILGEQMTTEEQAIHAAKTKEIETILNQQSIPSATEKTTGVPKTVATAQNIEIKKEQEKTPAQQITEARTKYLRLYAQSFKDKGAFARGLMNLGHSTGLIQKDSEKFLSDKAKAAKLEYENLKNSIEQEKFDRLKAKGKSETEVIAVIQRYRKITRQLDLLEQESEILKSAREKAFHSKKLEAFKKNFTWYTNLKPKQKKALSLGLSIGIGATAGLITGGGTIAATVGARVIRFAAGTGAGKLTSMIGEKIWKTGAGGKYETSLEELKKQYLSGDITPVQYQETKEALEMLENKVKAIKTAATMGSAFGAGIGTGAGINAVHSINTPDIPKVHTPDVPETHTPEVPESTVTVEDSGLALNPENIKAADIQMQEMIPAHDFNTVSPDAVAKPGESIWEITKRQIQHNPELAKILDVHNNPTNAELVKMLRGFGYISDKGDVRIADFTNTAYELATVDGQPVIHEYHNGQFVETRTLATGTEQGTVDTHEVFHDKEIKQPVVTTQTTTETIPMIETTGAIETTPIVETTNVATETVIDTNKPNLLEMQNQNTNDTIQSSVETQEMMSIDSLANQQYNKILDTNLGSNSATSWNGMVKNQSALSFITADPTTMDAPYAKLQGSLRTLGVELGIPPTGTIDNYIKVLARALAVKSQQ